MDFLDTEHLLLTGCGGWTGRGVRATACCSLFASACAGVTCLLRRSELLPRLLPLTPYTPAVRHRLVCRDAEGEVRAWDLQDFRPVGAWRCASRF